MHPVRDDTARLSRREFLRGRPWLEYAAHCQSMLRQGHFVADLVYFAGENAPVQPPLHVQEDVAATLIGQRAAMSPPPVGHDYDVADREAVLRGMKVVAGSCCPTA